VSGIDVLSVSEVAELCTRLDDIKNRLGELSDSLYEVEQAWLERPHEVVLHFLGAWLIDERFRELVFHPAATVPCAQLLDTDRLRFWHDQVFWKPPRHRGVVPWHQDYSYWTRTGPPAHISMFIALDDMGPENGGLEYVPGSHRWGLLPWQDFGGGLDALLEHLTPEQKRAFQPVPQHLRAGQATIHHSHLIHGSKENPSARPRRATVLNYLADGTLVTDGAQPLLHGVDPIETGRPVAGRFFPLVT
jgi:ectoine hydroxylase-related dioxygenase (phytanoyl-CoA dioxygenase family)